MYVYICVCVCVSLYTYVCVLFMDFSVCMCVCLGCCCVSSSRVVCIPQFFCRVVDEDGIFGVTLGCYFVSFPGLM